MDILIASPSFPPAAGGVAHVVQQHVEHLAGMGHRVTVITASEGADNGETTTAQGVRVLRLPVKAGRFPVYAAGDRFGIRQPAVRAQYQGLLQHAKADVLITHCWQAWNTDWAVDIAERLRFPVCLFSHGTSVNDTTGRTGLLRWFRWRSYAWCRMPATLRRIALLITLHDQADNNRFYDVALAIRHVTPIAVVANAANAELDNATPWQPEEVRTHHVALCVCQFTPEKNPAQVLDAFVRHAPPDWSLVVCGSRRTAYLERLEARYRRQARRRAVPPVSFQTGLSASQIMGLYKRADLFLAASRTECQPLVVLDAMAAALPFVSTDVGCLRSLPGGIVVRSRGDFERETAALMMDARLRARLADAGRHAYEALYNRAVTFERLEAALRSLTSARGGAASV